MKNVRPAVGLMARVGALALFGLVLLVSVEACKERVPDAVARGRVSADEYARGAAAREANRRQALRAFTSPAAPYQAGPPQTPHAATFAQSRWKEEPSGFRGIAWGTGIGEVKKAWPGLQQYYCPDDCLRLDDGAFEVGTIPTETSLYFRHGRLVQASMLFWTADYPSMKKLFVDKYGPPHKPNDENGDPGASWTGATVRISLSRDNQAGCKGRTCQSFAFFAVLADEKETAAKYREWKANHEAEQERKKARAKDAF